MSRRKGVESVRRIVLEVEAIPDVDFRDSAAYITCLCGSYAFTTISYRRGIALDVKVEIRSRSRYSPGPVQYKRYMCGVDSGCQRACWLRRHPAGRYTQVVRSMLKLKL